MSWYVYMLRCKDGSLYTGYTDDVERRVACHNSGKGAKYTRSRLPATLVYQEECADKAAALRREYAIKQLPRQKKLDLLANPALLPQFLPQLEGEAYEYISGVTLEACVEGTWNDETVCSAP